MTSKALQEIDNFRNEVLRALLKRCTEKEQEFFNRIYESVDKLIAKNDSEKIRWAIQLCERTLLKKEKNNDQQSE